MNREHIIRMAREAYLIYWRPNSTFSDGVWWMDAGEPGDELERFASLVAAAAEEQWKQAVINELVCCHIYNATHDNDPRKALRDAINWNVQVALDPQVSSDAQALIDRGAAAEREACAKVCDDIDTEYEGEDVLATWCAAAIRARGQA